MGALGKCDCGCAKCGLGVVPTGSSLKTWTYFFIAIPFTAIALAVHAALEK